MASHLRFLGRFAGGELDGGVSAAVEASVVITMSGCAQAVMVLEGHRCRRRRHFRDIVAVVCVGNRQKKHHVLVANSMIDGDACYMTSGDTDVI